MDYIIVEFPTNPVSAHVVSDPANDNPILFGSIEEAHEWAFEGNIIDYRIDSL